MPEPVTAYLSLGSNVGDRLQNLRRACASLAERGVAIRRASSVYETEPVDMREQTWFLNAVIEVETALPPLRLLYEIEQVEAELEVGVLPAEEVDLVGLLGMTEGCHPGQDLLPWGQTPPEGAPFPAMWAFIAGWHRQWLSPGWRRGSPLWCGAGSLPVGTRRCWATRRRRWSLRARRACSSPP